MRLPRTPAALNVTVKRLIPGDYDSHDNWVEAQDEVVASIVDASILPKSGNERATAIQTAYDSDYTMWVGYANVTFAAGYDSLERGDLVEDSKGRKFRVVFPGDWGPAFEVALKEELKG